MENTGLKVLVHASAFFMPFLVPFIVYLISEDYEVKKLAVQAVLFQIVMAVLIFLAVLLSFLLIGIPLLVIFGLMTLIVPIFGIVRAVNGQQFNYPIVGSFYR
ncbi:DUF4870 domain-containing protein [Indiicoccus explosivorum]|uniref:DUF4870 domain-containing protein n=1 Tax=Indiicoccus explosivorum TaxID=1917864 RepID=UPI000B44AD86|nr:DUF4870 domain-containing protein [Indiicoccus explosivorum]